MAVDPVRGMVGQSVGGYQDFSWCTGLIRDLTRPVVPTGKRPGCYGRYTEPAAGFGIRHPVVVRHLISDRLAVGSVDPPVGKLPHDGGRCETAGLIRSWTPN